MFSRWIDKYVVQNELIYKIEVELWMQKANLYLPGINWEIGMDIYTLLYTLIREGNGNPLQYSCLEKPMGGGAW